MAVFTSNLRSQTPRSASSAVIAAAALIALLYFGQIFAVTVVIAVIVAFMLDPFVELLARIRIPRGLGSFIACTVALLTLYLAGLGIYSQAGGLLEDLPTYSQRISELVDDVIGRLDAMERETYRLLVPKRMREREKQAEAQVQPPEKQSAAARRRRSAEPPALPPPIQEVRIRQEERTPVVGFLYSNLGSVYEVALMASFVPFLVYFMLSWRDHIRRSFLQLFEGSDRLVAGKSWEGIASMARAYVVGNFVLGILLSVVSSALFFAFKLPYPLLIGPASGFLSLVPYIGMPLALIPPFFAALPIYNKLTAFLIIGSSVAFFHLIALNLLYPKLVGGRVHLNPLAVTIALMFWGTVWGGIGLVLAVPITAGIKAVCDNVEELQPYGRMLGD